VDPRLRRAGAPSREAGAEARGAAGAVTSKTEAEVFDDGEDSVWMTKVFSREATD